MTSFKLEAVADRTANPSTAPPRAAPCATERAERPTLWALLRRSGLPLLMLLIVGGTPLWGGYVTLGLAVIAWRLAGVLL